MLMNAPNIVQLNHEQLEEVITTSVRPFILEFWKNDSGTCDIMEPIFRRLEENFGDRIDFFRCQAETINVIPQKFYITCVPTYVMYKENQIVEILNGITPYRKFIRLMANILKE
jgi:thioredoxin 1